MHMSSSLAYLDITQALTCQFPSTKSAWWLSVLTYKSFQQSSNLSIEREQLLSIACCDYTNIVWKLIYENNKTFFQMKNSYKVLLWYPK